MKQKKGKMDWKHAIVGCHECTYLSKILWSAWETERWMDGCGRVDKVKSKSPITPKWIIRTFWKRQPRRWEGSWRGFPANQSQPQLWSQTLVKYKKINKIRTKFNFFSPYFSQCTSIILSLLINKSISLSLFLSFSLSLSL